MARPLKIGITCYPSVGGSGILASALGEELARRGEEVHFISYERPFRLPADAPRLFFHPVVINDYGLFKYPDYTLPLSVKMAEVSRDHQLDVLHVHYAVPHATAAILARAMLPPEQQPRVVTTLHGTDTTLLGRDPGYAPAIRHALACSDAVTTVSAYLRRETQDVLGVTRPIDVIHNFFEPRPPRRSREEVRRELGLRDEVLVLHSSNLRAPKRIDLLAGGRGAPPAPRIFQARHFGRRQFCALRGRSAAARFAGPRHRPRKSSRHRGLPAGGRPGPLHLGTGNFLPEHFGGDVFCLSERRHRASVASRKWWSTTSAGCWSPLAMLRAMAAAVEELIRDPARRRELGRAAQLRARDLFSADVIVPRYQALYRRVCGN